MISATVIYFRPANVRRIFMRIGVGNKGERETERAEFTELLNIYESQKYNNLNTVEK